jgi:hypothetical protein
MNIQYSTEMVRNHPIDQNKVTGIHIVVHVEWYFEFHHNHVFTFNCDGRTFEKVDALIAKMEAAKLNLNHFKNSEHWTIISKGSN